MAQTPEAGSWRPPTGPDGSEGFLRDQAGIPASGGGQLRRFPRALRLDDLLVEPDDEPRRRDSTRPETTKEATPPAEQEYLDLKSLAAYSRIGIRTLRSYLKRRVQPLPHYRIAKKILVRRAEFDEWLNTFRHAADGDEIGRMVDDIFSGLTRTRPRPNTPTHSMRRGRG